MTVGGMRIDPVVKIDQYGLSLESCDRDESLHFMSSLSKKADPVPGHEFETENVTDKHLMEQGIPQPQIEDKAIESANVSILQMDAIDEVKDTYQQTQDLRSVKTPFYSKFSNEQVSINLPDPKTVWLVKKERKRDLEKFTSDNKDSRGTYSKAISFISQSSLNGTIT